MNYPQQQTQWKLAVLVCACQNGSCHSCQIYLFFLLPETILSSLSSALENTIITLFVMRPEGVFVLRFQLSCLIALKFNVFPLPPGLEIYLVFFSHCCAVSVCATGSVRVCLCPAVFFFVFRGGVTAVWRLAEGLSLITARGPSGEIVQTGPSRSASPERRHTTRKVMF